MEPTDVLNAISEQPFFMSEGQEFEACSPAEKVFIAVYDLESEINNGGFDQYYFNTAGQNGAMAPEAFDAIGAHATAAIIRKANAAAFPHGVPREREERLKQMEEWPEDGLEILSACDDEFYEYPEDLETLLYDFVVRNRASIRGASRALNGSLIDRIKGLFGRES